jgi:hypothetical protein
MKRIAVVIGTIFVLGGAASLQAQDCSGDVAALRALYEVRQMIFRPFTSSYDVSSRLDEHMDAMREPLPDGSYRWVNFVRPSGDGPVAKKEHTVNAEYGGDHDSFEATATHPFAVKVVVPRKRSLMKANKDVYVGTLEVHYWVDGREKTMSKTIDQWMAPDTSKSYDLGVIADRADAAVEVSAKDASRKESLVELHFKQAVARDNPDNPNYEAIQALQRVASSSNPATIDYEIARFEKRLFPELIPTPYATLFSRLQEAQKLMKSSKEDEQEKGKKLLDATLKQIGQ